MNRTHRTDWTYLAAFALLIAGGLAGVQMLLHAGTQPAAAAVDAYRTFPNGLAPTGPAEYHADITPGDADIAITRAIYVGTGGTLVCTLAGDSEAGTYTNVGDGVILPFRVVNVSSNGTTATGLVGLY